MHIRLLGGVSAVSDDGHALDVGPAKCQAVLAALALSAGAAVPVSRLTALVWGSEPPRTAEKTLQSYVTRLRKAVGQHAIRRAGASYLLDVDPDAVDALRFQALLDEGEIEAALAIWTGQPLAGLDGEGFQATTDGLVERWLGAVETNLADVVERDTGRAVAELTELTADHPFREGLWALLMIGLYRLGRQADALAAYQRARAVLIDQLGVEPGPRLQELEARILNHDLHHEPAVPSAAVPPASAPMPDRRDTRAAGGHLPVPPTRLFGRDDHIASVIDLLDRHRLVTLTGLGGAGKTRLALAVAAKVTSSFPDGVFFAPLAHVGRDDQIDRAVADSLGLTVGATDQATIANFIGSRRLLLVLDNCEQVIDQVAGLAVDAMMAGANGRLLATSREALDIDGERRVAVEPLTTDTPASPGVQLLLHRAGHAHPELGSDPPSLATLLEISARLDGIPLALELAAAQLAYLTPDELAGRLDERFEILVRSRPGRLSQHQTLQATMAWSWELLTERERATAALLSVFVDGWTLDDATGVAAPDATGNPADGRPNGSATSMALQLRSLEAKSLVVAEQADPTSTGSNGGGTRYRMLETVRLYAGERLTSTDGTDRARERHARHFCDAAAAVSFIDRYLEPEIGVRWAAEAGNIGAVLDWLRGAGRLAEAATLLTMPATAWRGQPTPPGIRSAVEELLSAQLPPRARCELLIAHIDATIGWRGIVGRSGPAQAVVGLASDLDDSVLRSVGLLLAGSPLGAVDPDRAEQLLTASIEAAERAGEERLMAIGLTMLAGVHAFGRQRYDESRSLLEQAAPLASRTGFDHQAVLAHRLTLEAMTGAWAASADAYRQLVEFHHTAGLSLSWSDSIDDAVFAGQLGEHRDRPLATAVERLEAAGGVADDWPDLLVVPLGQACVDEEWGRAARIISALRASARAGRRLTLPNATAYYVAFRRRVPSADIERADIESVAAVLADELTAEDR